MVRDYRPLFEPEPGRLRRRIVAAVGGLIVLLAALQLLVPSARLMQQAEAPDGRRAARLLRVRDVRSHLVVKVRAGRLWHTVYYSPPITNEVQMLGARLAWSPDAAQLFLVIQGRRLPVYAAPGAEP